VSKLQRIGFWCAFGGFAAVLLGVTGSGGIGPCGPQHPGPFLAALAGLATFAIGVIMLIGALFQAVFRRFKVPASSDSH